MSLRDAASSGDRLAALRALRDKLAAAIEDCESGRDLAALSGRLADVLAQIDALSPSETQKGTPLDELAKRRAARGAATSGTRRAASGAVRRR